MTTPVNGSAGNGYRAQGYGLTQDYRLTQGYRTQDYRTQGYGAAERLYPAEPQLPGRGGPAELFLDEPPQVTPPPPLRSTGRSGPSVRERADWSAIGAPATPPAAPPPPTPKGPRLRVDWPNCKAHGLCHELLPEAIRLDEWGYPIVGRDGLPQQLLDDARRAVMSCPTLALRIVD